MYAASDRIKEFIDVPVSTKGTVIPTEEPQTSLMLENVKFSYPSNPDIKVLQDVSITVGAENRVVAIVGQSGCGKSSIISLIEQFYRPQFGRITFNNKDVKTIDQKWYH